MSMLMELMFSYKDRLALIWQEKCFYYNDLIKDVMRYRSLIEKNIGSSGKRIVLEVSPSYFDIALIIASLTLKNTTILVDKNSNQKEAMKSQIEYESVLEVDADGYLLIKKYKESGIEENIGSMLVLFTSGTSGAPKAVLHDFESMLNSKLPSRQKNRNHKMLLILSIDHIGGFNTLLQCLSHGLTLVIPNSLSAHDVLKAIERWKVNILPASPTFLRIILLDIQSGEMQYDLSSLKLITLGAEVVDVSVVNKIRRFIKNVKVSQTYGTTEIGIVKVSTHPENPLLFKIDDDNYDYTIVNQELLIKPRLISPRYINVEKSILEADGYYHTGDLVREEKSGYLRIIGRKKDFINVGGAKVLPIEVEEQVMKIDYIEDVTVYAIPNQITGESVGCDVVISPKIQIDDEKIKNEIRRICALNLDRHKIPVKIRILKDVKFTNRLKKSRG